MPIRHQRYELGEVLKQSIIQMCGKRKRDSSDDERRDGNFIPPQGKGSKRFPVSSQCTEEVVTRTAHRRRHVNQNYQEIFTCPVCRRPLAARKPGGELEYTRFAFTSKEKTKKGSKKRPKLIELRALALDHNPPWAGRERDLKGRNATRDEMEEDYTDPKRMRALCKKCNECHKHESTKKIKDYESDTEEEGYKTPDDEPENKGKYKPYRYDENDDPGAGGAGVTT